MHRLAGIIGTIASLPIVAVLAIGIRLDSPGPAIYPAARMGRGGRQFTCFKLRTMRWDPAGGGGWISVASDPRVTRFGRLLRRAHLDELPQFWNVARGEMVIIGPRPEDPRFVDLSQELHRTVFTATPGITGAAQLAFANEAASLRGDDAGEQYRAAILPAKLEIDAAYLDRRSMYLDAWILVQTIATAAGRPPDPMAVRRHLGLPPG